MIKKIISFLIIFCLVLQQTGFCQVVGQFDISSRIVSTVGNLVVDKYRPVHLRSLAYDQLGKDYNLLIEKGDNKNLDNENLKKITSQLLEYFFVGISLPNDSFWVNLRPDAINEIMDEKLAKTDVGKILIEADLQLKKDTAKYTSPKTPEGKEYWDKLYQKAEEIYGSKLVSIPTLNRPWIVPGEIIVSDNGKSAFIYKAILNVMLEDDYLKGSQQYNFKDEKAKELNEYSSKLLKSKIIPKLTKEINSAKRYAPLRQVYYSLILAQWFKNKYPSNVYSKDFESLTSKVSWNKNTYYQAYKKSFNDGEYNIKEAKSSINGQVIRSYVSGGIVMGAELLNQIKNSQINTSLPIDFRKSWSGEKYISAIVSANGQITLEQLKNKIKNLVKEKKEIQNKLEDNWNIAIIGGNNVSNQKSINFTGHIFIGAGKYSYKVWVDEKDRVNFSRVGENNELLGNIRYFSLGQEIKVGQEKLNNDYYFVNGESGLAPEHFAFKITKSQNSYNLFLQDKATKTGTKVSWQLEVAEDIGNAYGTVNISEEGIVYLNLKNVKVYDYSVNGEDYGVLKIPLNVKKVVNHIEYSPNSKKISLDINRPDNSILRSLSNQVNSLVNSKNFSQETKAIEIFKLVRRAFAKSNIDYAARLRTASIDIGKIYDSISGDEIGLDPFIKSQTGVCLQHSLLFYKLAQVAGLKCSPARGMDGVGHHIWVEVYLENGETVLVDPFNDTFVKNYKRAVKFRNFTESLTFYGEQFGKFTVWIDREQGSGEEKVFLFIKPSEGLIEAKGDLIGRLNVYSDRIQGVGLGKTIKIVNGEAVSDGGDEISSNAALEKELALIIENANISKNFVDYFLKQILKSKSKFSSPKSFEIFTKILKVFLKDNKLIFSDSDKKNLIILVQRMHTMAEIFPTLGVRKEFLRNMRIQELFNMPSYKFLYDLYSNALLLGDNFNNIHIDQKIVDELKVGNYESILNNLNDHSILKALMQHWNVNVNDLLIEIIQKELIPLQFKNTSDGKTQVNFIENLTIQELSKHVLDNTILSMEIFLKVAQHLKSKDIILTKFIARGADGAAFLAQRNGKDVIVKINVPLGESNEVNRLKENLKISHELFKSVVNELFINKFDLIDLQIKENLNVIIEINEYVKGDTLKTKLSKETLSLTDKIEYLKQFLGIHKFLYQNALINRDTVNFSNIIFDSERLKLRWIDYGNIVPFARIPVVLETGKNSVIMGDADSELKKLVLNVEKQKLILAATKFILGQHFNHSNYKERYFDPDETFYKVGEEIFKNDFGVKSLREWDRIYKIFKECFENDNLTIEDFVNKFNDGGINKNERVDSLKKFKDKIKNDNFSEVLSFGDKHGKAEDLERVLEFAKQAVVEGRKVEIIGHGDVFDRGEENAKNFKILIELKKIAQSNPNVKVNFCLGNHDIWMIEAILLHDQDKLLNWKFFGGNTVIREFKSQQLKDLALWIFNNSKFFYIDNLNFLHVHAGIPVDSKGNPVITRDDLNKFQAELDNLQAIQDPMSPDLIEQERIKALFVESEPLFMSRENSWLDKLTDEKLIDNFLANLDVNGVYFGHNQLDKIYSLDNRIIGIDVDNNDVGHVIFNQKGVIFNSLLRNKQEVFISKEEILNNFDKEIKRLDGGDVIGPITVYDGKVVVFEPITEQNIDKNIPKKIYARIEIITLDQMGKRIIFAKPENGIQFNSKMAQELFLKLRNPSEKVKNLWIVHRDISDLIDNNFFIIGNKLVSLNDRNEVVSLELDASMIDKVVWFGSAFNSSVKSKSWELKQKLSFISKYLKDNLGGLKNKNCKTTIKKIGTRDSVKDIRGIIKPGQQTLDFEDGGQSFKKIFRGQTALGDFYDIGVDEGGFRGFIKSQVPSKKITEIDLSKLTHEEFVFKVHEAIDNKMAIELIFNGLISKYKAGHLRFIDIAEKLFALQASLDKQSGYVIKELVKNAIYYGGLLNLKHSVFIYFEKNNDGLVNQVKVYDYRIEGILDPLLINQAGEGFGGQNLGFKRIREFGWDVNIADLSIKGFKATEAIAIKKSELVNEDILAKIKFAPRIYDNSEEIKKMFGDKKTVVFDMDGTILDNMVLRPEIKSLVESLKRNNYAVVIWTLSGKETVERLVIKYPDLFKQFDLIITKESFAYATVEELEKHGLLGNSFFAPNRGITKKPTHILFKNSVLIEDDETVQAWCRNSILVKNFQYTDISDVEMLTLFGKIKAKFEDGGVGDLERILKRGITIDEYLKLNKDEKNYFRIKFFDNFHKLSRAYTLLEDKNVMKVIEEADKLLKNNPNARIFSLGETPIWFVETAKLKYALENGLNENDPQVIARFGNVPFSGRWQRNINSKLQDFSFGPNSEQIDEYKKYLTKIKFDPKSIVENKEKTVLVEFITSAGGLESFLSVILDWAKEMDKKDNKNVEQQVKEKLKIYLFSLKSNYYSGKEEMLKKTKPILAQFNFDYNVSEDNFILGLGNDEFFEDSLGAHFSYLDWNSNGPVYKLHENAVLVKIRLLDFLINRKFIAQEKLADGGKGGIDFISLPITNQPNLSRIDGGIALPGIAIKDLDKELVNIENMLRSGLKPSAHRLKKLVNSCSQKEKLVKYAGSILYCMAEVMSLEEEKGQNTEILEKEIIVLLESNAILN